MARRVINLGEAAKIVAYHRWPGSLYADCSCGRWKALGRHGEPVSFPAHVAKSIFDEFGISYENKAGDA